jgi:hypothetical protein
MGEIKLGPHEKTDTSPHSGPVPTLNGANTAHTVRSLHTGGDPWKYRVTYADKLVAWYYSTVTEFPSLPTRLPIN